MILLVDVDHLLGAFAGSFSFQFLYVGAPVSLSLDLLSTFTHVLMTSSILIYSRGLIGSILIIHIYVPILDHSPELQTHIPSYLITFLTVPYQSLNSWFLLSDVLLYQCVQFCSMASLLTQCLHPKAKAFKILL